MTTPGMVILAIVGLIILALLWTRLGNRSEEVILLNFLNKNPKDPYEGIRKYCENKKNPLSKS